MLILALIAFPILISLITSWLTKINVFYILFGFLTIFQLAKYALLSLIILNFVTSILLLIAIIRRLTDRGKAIGTLSLQGSKLTLNAIFFPVAILIFWDFSRSNHFPPIAWEFSSLWFYISVSSIVCLYVSAMVVIGTSLIKKSEETYVLIIYGVTIKKFPKDQVVFENDHAIINFMGNNHFKIHKNNTLIK